jgi:mycofactocin glycosyltransferase
MKRRFQLDSSYRRPGNGPQIIGGSPLRLYTVTQAGADLLATLERAQSVDVPSGSATERLINRFIDGGVIHPVLSDDDDGARAIGLTIVVPSRNDTPPSRSGRVRTIIVDDGSVPPLSSPGTARDAMVEIIRLDHNLGPARARNAGLEHVTTPVVAFVDADVEIDDDALARLVWHFDDPTVAVVAPRVMSTAGPGVLARFERSGSPLDMGAQPARVAATTRVSYVPAAVLVCRVEAIRAVGGFDGSLRFGEDVDLVWRLVEAGWRCRYDPAVIALHRTRPSLRDWLRQRFDYGTSAAELEARHPGALAPVRMSGWSAATWVPIAAGHPIVGVTIGVGSAAALVRKLRTIPASESFRLAALGNLYAGRVLCAAVSRTWWPAAVALSLVSRRARRALVVAATVPAMLDWIGQRPPLDPIRSAALRVLDDGAYGAGVWAGAVKRRSIGALLPRFEAWPPRSQHRGHEARAEAGPSDYRGRQ